MGKSGEYGLIYQIMEVSEHALYVLSKDDFHIICANEKAKKIFGDNLTSLTCYQGIETKQLPCINCPFILLQEGQEYITERYLESFDMKVKVKAKGLKWEDGSNVVLCKILDSDGLLQKRWEQDILTDIPNVNRFYIDAGHMIMNNKNQNYAIISFDIDKFKLINDLFGMRTGDKVLKHVANVIKEQETKEMLYCRVHSDVFLLCIPYQKRGDIIKLIERIRKGIYRNDFSFDINTSFGIYLAEDATIPINLMCDRANLAARTVKGNAMKFCAFYDEQYRTEIIKTTEIEKDMNLAISNKQFLMYLQPKYNLMTGRICGAEVLVRWKHPVKGLIQPNDFIPLFEKNGFILRLDEYMWEEACKTIARWQAEGKEPVPLSVNISRYHIKNNDLVGVWKKLIQKYEIPASYLILEITETFFYDSEDLYTILAKLQGMGFELEIDDFGSGYSSLNMIRRVPVNAIKMDKDFLDKKLATDKGKIVISHTIAMAKDLHLGVIAEGVETKEHVDFLKSSACDIAQGYFFAKPMPLEDFNELYYESPKSESEECS